MPVREVTAEEALGGKFLVVSANSFPGLAKEIAERSRKRTKGSSMNEKKPGKD